LPVYLSGFFLAVLLGAVFSSFNSLLNSAATLFVLDVYQPLIKRQLKDSHLIKVAKIASVVIAIFSFIVAPLLQYAPEGLWQIIRIFTGFYNIPVIAVVVVGLFARHVPAYAAKVAIGFHLVAYALLQFVFQVDIHFIHLYAILFVIELAIMLGIGYARPLANPWTFAEKAMVDMKPWRYAGAASAMMFAGIAVLYLVFSPLGVVGGFVPLFWWAMALVIGLTIVFSCWSVSRAN
jgi:SSS family solute:Na+ symporter